MEAYLWVGDFSEADINSMEDTFPGLFVLICDFHGEQAWKRDVWKGEHGVAYQDRGPFMALLRAVAYSSTKPSLI